MKRDTNIEDLGFVEKGDGGRASLEGETAIGGRIAVNTSGGLLAKGHPIGATCVSMHAVTAMQLTGTAGDMQVGNASLGGIFRSLADASAVLVLPPRPAPRCSGRKGRGLGP